MKPSRKARAVAEAKTKTKTWAAAKKTKRAVARARELLAELDTLVDGIETPRDAMKGYVHNDVAGLRMQFETFLWGAEDARRLWREHYNGGRHAE